VRARGAGLDLWCIISETRFVNGFFCHAGFLLGITPYPKSCLLPEDAKACAPIPDLTIVMGQRNE
jgi:hypothetical protein